MKKVALFGGSFNPPHIGHKMLIELVRDTFPCDEIWLMPSGDRLDKKMDVESKHRKEMASIFAEQIQKKEGPVVRVVTLELERNIPTATIDTLRELQHSYPDHEFHFIMSSELVPDVKGYWEEGETLFNTTRFILIERPGSHLLDTLELPPMHTILTPLSPLPQLSSTYIRSLSSQEELLKTTPEEIAEYIITHGLYGFKSSDH